VTRTRVEAGNIGYLRIAGFDAATQASPCRPRLRILRQKKTGGKLIGFIHRSAQQSRGSISRVRVGAVADAFIDQGDIVIVKGRKPNSLKRISGDPGRSRAGHAALWCLVNGGHGPEA